MFIVIAAAAGGGVMAVLLLLTLIVYIRSRGVKWVDRIGIHHLTSKKYGALSIVQDILTFQYLVTYESFIKKWSPIISSYPIFTHLVRKRRFLWSYFETQPDFDISNHMFCVEEPMTMDEIGKYCQQQLMEPLSEMLPLWRVIIFSNVVDCSAGQSVLLLRYHQCLADGFSMLQLLLTESQHTLEDTVVDDISIIRESINPMSSSSSSSSSSITIENEQIEEVLDMENLNMEKSNHTTTTNDDKNVQDKNNDNKNEEQVDITILLNPPVLPSIPKKHCGVHSTYAGSYWKMVCAAKDKANPLRSKQYVDIPKTRYGSYSLMNTGITDLEDLKQYDLTINDAILGAIFNSIQSFFYPQFQQTHPKHIHSILWINTKANDFLYTPLLERDKLQLSNSNVSALVLELPSTLNNAWDSTMNAHHQLWVKSNSQEARVARRWLWEWGWLPRGWSDNRFANFTRRGSFSVSIVAGPQQKISINGNPITSIMTVAPPIGNEDVHFSVMCYNNKIAIAIAANDCILDREGIDSLLMLCDHNLEYIRTRARKLEVVVPL